MDKFWRVFNIARFGYIINKVFEIKFNGNYKFHKCLTILNHYLKCHFLE
jgi:hypothetical protein